MNASFCSVQDLRTVTFLSQGDARNVCVGRGRQVRLGEKEATLFSKYVCIQYWGMNGDSSQANEDRPPGPPWYRQPPAHQPGPDRHFTVFMASWCTSPHFVSINCTNEAPPSTVTLPQSPLRWLYKLGVISLTGPTWLYWEKALPINFWIFHAWIFQSKTHAEPSNTESSSSEREALFILLSPNPWANSFCQRGPFYSIKGGRTWIWKGRLKSRN